MLFMGEAPEDTTETPEITIEDYVTVMGELDRNADLHGSRVYEARTEEFYGMLKGWEEDTHKFMHEIASVRTGVRMFTKACLEDNDKEHPKYLNAPEKIEHYQMLILSFKDRGTIYINSRDPKTAREIHACFFEILQQCSSTEEALDWLLKISRYSRMKSPEDPALPLIDIVPGSKRKNL